MKKKVLILCTGNSCRSIMAEALINHELGEWWEASSAGTHPTSVNPRAVQVMNELGIDMTPYASKSVLEFTQRNDIDLVVTVCGDARENCPIFLRPIRKIHVGFPDPAQYTHLPDDEALPEFRKVRDTIRTVLLPTLKQFYEMIK